jgi:hypothetical protein
MSSLEINLNLSATVQQPFAPSSAGLASNRDKDKYPVDDIKDPTPCTIMYVKSSISSSIEVVKATVMLSCILHGEPIPIECAPTSNMPKPAQIPHPSATPLPQNA